MTTITTIIPCRNDQEWADKTVRSIHENSCNPCSVLVTDDASYVPLSFRKEHPRTKILRLKEPQGIAFAKDFGAQKAKDSDVFVFADAHMLFPKDWDKTVTDMLSDDPSSIACFAIQSIDCPKSSIAYGTTLTIVDTVSSVKKAFYASPKVQKTDMTAFPIGAYAITKKRFDEILGHGKLIGAWGDNVFIGLKNWVMGGKCLVSNKAVFQHLYRERPPYNKENWMILYNKIRMAHTILPGYFAASVFSLLPKTDDVEKAMQHVMRNFETFAIERIAIDRRRVVDIENLPEKLFKTSTRKPKNQPETKQIEQVRQNDNQDTTDKPEWNIY